MKRIAPDYYPQFHCIADQCRHNCCIGWEIDIDEDTLAYYQSLDGEMGERLRKNICLTDETPHFILSDHERCPFLNDRNLCDIILSCGEGALCQICDDHPRFYNDFSDRTEVGIGLCCEEAGRLILDQSEKMQLITISDDPEIPDAEADDTEDHDESALFALRDRLFALAQNRALPIAQRMENILAFCGVQLPKRSFSAWADIYAQLEQLDPAWSKQLDGLRHSVSLPDASWDTAFEQLLCYFLYRHMPGALCDGCIQQRAAFCVLSTQIIRALCGSIRPLTLGAIAEISRMYSSEIEYSDENVSVLLDILTAE